MLHSALIKFQAAARGHAGITAGLWFSLAAFLPLLPVLLVTCCLGCYHSLPAWAVINLLVSLVVLPVLLAGLAGMLLGGKILCLPSRGTPRAALYGLAAGLIAFILWGIALEITPDLPAFTASNYPSGDVPGAAAAVGYLVVLPGLVMAVMAYGAATGILLHLISIYSPAAPDQQASGGKG